MRASQPRVLCPTGAFHQYDVIVRQADELDIAETFSNREYFERGNLPSGNVLANYTSRNPGNLLASNKKRSVMYLDCSKGG